MGHAVGQLDRSLISISKHEGLDPAELFGRKGSIWVGFQAYQYHCTHISFAKEYSLDLSGELSNIHNIPVLMATDYRNAETALQDREFHQFLSLFTDYLRKICISLEPFANEGMK